MTQPRTLSLIVYAPALAGKDSRALDVIHGMEKALPGLRLEWRISESGRPIPLPQRDAWLRESIDDGGFPLVCNGDETYPITVLGCENSALFSPGGQAQFEVHAKLPLDQPAISAAAGVLEAMGEGAHSFWGHASPQGYGSEIAKQLRRTANGPDRSPRGLPMLNLPEKLPTKETPSFLGWVNYWSAAAARAIGFPDAARDTELLTRARRTASGGWVVQLTNTPLDYENPTHIDALLRAYVRFPTIGGRSMHQR